MQGLLRSALDSAGAVILEVVVETSRRGVGRAREEKGWLVERDASLEFVDFCIRLGGHKKTKRKIQRQSLNRK